MTNTDVSLITLYCYYTGSNLVGISKKEMEYVHLEMFASIAMVSSESLIQYHGAGIIDSI